MALNTTSQQQQQTATSALQKEWAAVQRHYHAQRIVAAQDADKATHLRCFVSLSDPDLPGQFKGETELLVTLPAKYPDEEPAFDLQYYKSRLTAAQFDAIDVAMRERAKELCGTLSLRKLLTWLDNKFYPLMMSTGEFVTSEDADMAEMQQDQVEAPDPPIAAANTDGSLVTPTPETTPEEQQHAAGKTKQKKDTSRKPCRFFLRQSCRSGDKCKFSHDIKKPKIPKPETTAAEAVDATAANSNAEHKEQVASAATNQKHSKGKKEDKVSSASPVESKPKKTKKPRLCKFLARNKCRDGEKCKFLHASSTKENADTETEKKQKSSGIVIKVLKASVKATGQGALDGATVSATDKRASSDEWSELQQKALDDALKQYSATMDKKIRWISIASEVNGKSLNECIDRFKYLCRIVRDEQPASAVAASNKAREAEEEEETLAAIDTRIVDSDSRIPIQTEPEVAGSQIRLEDLFLHQIGTLIPHRLVCQVQCNNCPLEFDAILGLDSVSIRKWCPRCSVLHLVSLRPVFAHAGSSILAYVDTNENCSVVDVVPSELLATCLECGNEVLLPSVTPGRRSEHACFSCHTKLALMVKRYVVGHVSGSSTSGGKAPSSPQLSPKSKQKQGGAKKVADNFVLGQPLPQKGACEHYKHSFRWFRFQCCGKAFPCDVCHDSSDCPQANMGKIASRMICGLCSKEQSSAIKECSCGNEVGRKKMVTSYWEGGTGCRNANLMSQNDKKKFRGLNKTESKKHSRVGADAKKQQQQRQSGATDTAPTSKESCSIRATFASSSASIVHYNLVERVNSEEYAICERFLDILAVTLPDFSVTKTPFRQDRWPVEAAEFTRIYGFRVPTSSQLVICDVIVWADTGRLLCTDVDAFSTFVQRHYDMQLDLSDAEVMLHIKANMDEMRTQQSGRAR